ncbi:hypothetical protein D3C75_1001670 [compost metagenome]
MAEGVEPQQVRARVGQFTDCLPIELAMARCQHRGGQSQGIIPVRQQAALTGFTAQIKYWLGRPGINVQA